MPTTAARLPQRATPASLAVLRHPDHHTSWVICLVAHLAAAVDGDNGPRVHLVGERLKRLHGALPILGARLRGETWYPGASPVLTTTRDAVSERHPVAECLFRPFDLATDAPLRVVADESGHWVGIAGHHAAFDGLGLASVLGALLDGSKPTAAPVPEHRPARWSDLSSWRGLARLATPADRVTPSSSPPSSESFRARPVELSGPAVTSRLAGAAATAIADRNARAGRRLRRMAISIGVGGPPGVGNVATCVCVEVRPGLRSEDAVAAALADRTGIPEMVPLARPVARVLSPVVGRLSDTVLVSNLGCVALNGVRRLDFYPVARGASGLALGAAGIPGQTSTLTLRSTRLDSSDLGELLDQVVATLQAGPPSPEPPDGG